MYSLSITSNGKKSGFDYDAAATNSLVGCYTFQTTNESSFGWTRYNAEHAKLRFSCLIWVIFQFIAYWISSVTM
ncbi:hypothetical protein F2P79_004096 [Pimephales promelas]|nr:hypothetical protein F2P79_004096 [Pimephales promelas]